MKTDTHGLTMIGLKAASSASKGVTGYFPKASILISYDTRNGKIWVEYYSCPCSGNVPQSETGVVYCGHVTRPATMQEIADMIYKAVSI